MSVPNNAKCLLWKPLSHNNYNNNTKERSANTIVYSGNEYTEIRKQHTLFINKKKDEQK